VQFPILQMLPHSYHDCASISQAPKDRLFVRLKFVVSVRLIARFALTAFMCQRIIEFRNALSGKAIAVFYFWRRHASINHSIDCRCILEFVNP